MKKTISMLLILVFLLHALPLTPAFCAEDEAEHYEERDLYYTDAYFRDSSLEYNPHLATASMILTKLSAPWGDPAKDPDWYQKQPEKAEKYYADIGFKDFATNEDYRVKTRFDTIGVAAAKKEMTFYGTDYTVIGVTPRSGGYALEWANNVYLGDGSKSDQMHEGWYNAAKKLIDFLKNYVAEKNVTGPVKLWMCGFSRGGAVTNIAAALLDNYMQNDPHCLGENVTVKREDLFAYTFEAPQGANVNSKNVRPPKDELYNNIWNIVNPNDLVPKVAMGQYGFTRFGIDRFITTEFYDPSNYLENRRTFLALYYGSNTSEFIADDFTMYGMPKEKIAQFVAQNVVSWVDDDVPSMNIKKIITRDVTKVNYDANIVVMTLIDELVANIGSRKDFCDKYQNGAKEAMLLIMGSESILADSAGYIVGAATALSLGLSFYAVTKSTKAVEMVLSTLSYAIPETNFKTAFKLLAPLFNVATGVYWEKPDEVISLAMQYEEVFQNHDTEVTIAHLQAQDSYYINAYNKTHSTSISLVPLRMNADLAQLSFDGLNDLGLRVNGEKRVDVEGFVWKNSVVHRCDPGFAVGFYSYATVEKMRLFFPVGIKVNVSMKDYSKKCFHYVYFYADYRHFSPVDKGKFVVQKSKMSDYVRFLSSDRYWRDVSFVSA